MKSFRILATCLLGIASTTSPIVWAQTAPQIRPYPTKATPKPIDMGALPSGTTPISITIALKMPKMEEAESLLQSIHTPGDPQYHKFLTADQFTARFAPSDTDAAKVIASLAKYGLSAQRTGTTTITATGSPANIERAFSVSLHRYEIPAHQKSAGYTFHAPSSSPTIPSEISASVAGVIGLDDRPTFRPHHLIAAKKLALPQSKQPASAGNPPGLWTVTDFAKYYDVKPLYKKGISGSGQTLGIMTFASFTPSDAFSYWGDLGLSVDPKRIKTVNVDGGPGAPSDESGSDETTLDVEQSGGVAPGAKIIVYQAPNTNQGFVDLFAAAIESNKAQSLSISWGSWEWLDNRENSPVTDPITGRTVGQLKAVHQLLVRAAIQGQTVFASTGDAGAYDVDDENCPLPECSATLSVDYPASDPAITAAGGTTLAGLQQLCLDAACDATYPVTVHHERVWSWTYLKGFCKYIGYDPISCGIFPVGGGGGVSIHFEAPSYQRYLPGVQRSQPDQAFTMEGQLFYVLPSNYPGRNLPDVSFNADPETGYIFYYTSDTSGFGVYAGEGGTSFVAPQLNGVSALLSEDLHSERLGLLNFPLYALAFTGQAYGGPGAPLNEIKYGNNDFYHGSKGYNPGAGLGTLDVANFAKSLRSLYWF